MAFSFFKNKTEINWTSITSMEQLDLIQTASFTKPQVVFKHSTTCSISKMAKGRMEDGIDILESLAGIYYLDLLAHRNISNEIANRWSIEHESPQILVIKDGKVTYHASHNMIRIEEIKNSLI